MRLMGLLSPGEAKGHDVLVLWELMSFVGEVVSLGEGIDLETEGRLFLRR